MKLDLHQIAQWAGADVTGLDRALVRVATGYSIDSRTLLPCDLFIAVKGERFD